jgi:hypothetical protein
VLVAQACNPRCSKVEIKRIVVQSQHRKKKVWETQSQKTVHKNRAGAVAQGEGPELKSQQKVKKKKKR